jgi:hypothetical protein
LYGVVAVDIFGNESDEVTYEWGTVGIADDGASFLSIYPNPVGDVLRVDNAGSYKTISILNMAGKTVWNSNVNQANLRISVDDLDKGLYIIRLEGKAGVHVSKFVKK